MVILLYKQSSAPPTQFFSFSQVHQRVTPTADPPDLHLDLPVFNEESRSQLGFAALMSLHHPDNQILVMLHILDASPLSSLTIRKTTEQACFSSPVISFLR